DWVESCTAVAEHHDGTFEVIRWVDRTQEEAVPAKAKEAPVAA
ncbi:MAG: UDP-2,3-diacylglucosamine diphosphatase, partial [Roseibium sp.]|nr:UDP-2,3-diacylglucosamine diphosphatase [Roseibium sp.]